jgi:hypothetical protein
MKYIIIIFFIPIILYAQDEITPDIDNINTKSTNNNAIGIKIDNFNASKISSYKLNVSVENDSLATNSITNLYLNNDVLFVDVRLENTNSKIKLSIYNMLAKEVLTIYDDIQSSKENRYQTSVSNLPNGAFICILVGNNFRDAEKFLISR